MQRLCVYCGSNRGARPEYADAAQRLARLLAERGTGLVYGGASRGIMGLLADAVLDAGGTVTGVMPRAIRKKELTHNGLTDLFIVDTMHERKAKMAELSDGFVALPGGFGTLEEIIEIVTWGQLQFHQKPCGILNVAGYFDSLLAFVEHAVAEGFLKSQHRDALIVDADPAQLLSRFDSFVPSTAQKWLE